jgi:hypothetical protein
MKKISISTFLLLPLLPAIILLTAYSGEETDYPGGSPAGYTGSPLDGKDCTVCHGGSASPVIGWITSDIPVEGYIPGETYTITTTVSGNGRKGFLISPQNEEGDFLGELATGPGTELKGNNHYITHSSSSNSNPKVWTFPWTAPASGSGPVTFYGAFTVNEPVTKLSTLTVTENISIGIPENRSNDIDIYPVPAKDHILFSFEDDSDAGKVNITDINGRTILSVNKAGGKTPYSINIKALPSGIYFLRVEAGKNFYSRKFLKE